MLLFLQTYRDDPWSVACKIDNQEGNPGQKYISGPVEACDLDFISGGQDQCFYEPVEF